MLNRVAYDSGVLLICGFESEVGRTFTKILSASVYQPSPDHLAEKRAILCCANAVP
jgi:hypothetical protein